MFKQVYTGFFVASTMLGVTGIIQVFHSEGLTKNIALGVGAAGTASALTTVGLGMAYERKEFNQADDISNEIQKKELVHKGLLATLEAEIKQLKLTIVTLESSAIERSEEIKELKRQLEIKAHQYLTAMTEKDLKVNALQGQINQRDSRVADFLEESRQHVITFLNLRNNNLDGIQSAINHGINQSDLAESLKQSLVSRASDIKKLKVELGDAIETIKTLDITNFKTVLDFIFEFDNKFLNVKVRWKDAQVKGIKTESNGLRQALDNSMPKPVALERFTEGMDEVDARITEKYESLLLNNNSIHAQLLDLLEQRNLVIDDLQKQNEELSKVVDYPFEMYGGSKYAENANKIAKYYNELLHKKLDCLDWQETELGYKLIFSVRRNPSITLNQLKQNESLEQIAYLAQALDNTTPEFTIHTHNATISLDVQTRRAIKKALPSTEDIFRECGVIRANLFGATVRKYHIDKTGKPTLRVMSATGGGKGIAVKNLVDYYLKNLEGYEIWLSDPQDGSEEDYWDCEKAATTPSSSSALFNRFAKLLQSRDAKTSNEPSIPILGVFDEFDKKHPVEDRKTVSQIWTTIRHHSMRLILIGQSGEVGKNSWTWNEMTNCSLLFITDAIPTFIKHAEKDLGMNPEKLKKFTDAHDKAKSYIDKINQDIEPENEYRLAALYCNGQALLLEIPQAHKGVLTDDKSWLTTTPFEKLNKSQTISEKMPESTDILSCPHCDSLKIIKKGANAKGQQLYSCKECSKSPLKFIPNINSINI